MTEAEWLECILTYEMLSALEGKTSKRKLRLFACACVRRVWQLLDKNSQQAVEMAEKHSDGYLGEDERRKWLRRAYRSRSRTGAGPAAWAAHMVLSKDGWERKKVGAGQPESYYGVARAQEVEWYVKRAEDGDVDVNYSRFYSDEPHRAHTNLLHDIFGNPFRPVTLDPSWLNPTVLSLAQAAYDNRALPSGTLDPQRLMVLSDALSDAGCDDEQVLTHLRGEGPHVRGCWVVDALLGKE